MGRRAGVIGLVIVGDPPEVRLSQQLLHHLIQSGKGKANRLIRGRRNGWQRWRARGKPGFADLVAEPWMRRIFYGAFDIRGRHLPFENGNPGPVERVMRQDHIIWGAVFFPIPSFFLKKAAQDSLAKNSLGAQAMRRLPAPEPQQRFSPSPRRLRGCRASALVSSQTTHAPF